jgi:hypothetical protein
VSPRRFPPLWSVDEEEVCVTVLEPADYVYFEECKASLGPVGPVAPGGPDWFQLSGFSLLAWQFSPAPVSITRRPPPLFA